MMYSIAYSISGIGAYLIGSVPTSFLFAKALKGIDIRQHGSGNVGATNVYRVVGKLPGLLTLIVDILKGVLAASFLPGFIYHVFGVPCGLDQKIVFGFLAICGHIWTPFLRFKGGKGVATTIGVLGILLPKLLVWYLLVWVIAFSFSRFVSLGSVVAGVSLPFLALIYDQSITVVLFAVILCSINTYKHKENIKRLIMGVESKTHLFRKK